MLLALLLFFLLEKLFGLSSFYFYIFGGFEIILWAGEGLVEKFRGSHKSFFSVFGYL